MTIAQCPIFTDGKSADIEEAQSTYRRLKKGTSCLSNTTATTNSSEAPGFEAVPTWQIKQAADNCSFSLLGSMVLKQTV